MKPFEGFLGDTRGRPIGSSLVGFATSLSLHGPPVTAFVVAWLTQTLVLGGGYYDLTDRERIVYYEVPIAMMSAFPSSYGRSRTGGSGAGAGVKADAGAGGADRAVAGKRGQRGRGRMGRGRRRIVRPHVTRPDPPAATRQVALGHGDTDDGLGAGLGEGRHAGMDKDGAGSSGSGLGSGGAGKGSGPGGGVPYLAAAGLPLAEKKPGQKLQKKGLDDEEAAGFGKDDEAVVGTPLPGRPERVSMDYAAYLRTYDVFPSLPESYWPGGVRTLTMLVEICVDQEGSVSDVVFRKSAGAETDAFLRPAIFAWRYRPRVIRGFSTAFCHPILIEYKRELFGRSW